MKSSVPKFLIRRFIFYTVFVLFLVAFLVSWRQGILLLSIVRIVIAFGILVALDLAFFFYRRNVATNSKERVSGSLFSGKLFL